MRKEKKGVLLIPARLQQVIDTDMTSLSSGEDNKVPVENVRCYAYSASCAAISNAYSSVQPAL